MAPRSKVHTLPPELKEWLDGELVARGFGDYVQLAADLKEGAPAMIASYLDGQDLETYSRQWHNAYEYGAANVKRDYAMASQAVASSAAVFTRAWPLPS